MFEKSKVRGSRVEQIKCERGVVLRRETTTIPQPTKLLGRLTPERGGGVEEKNEGALICKGMGVRDLQGNGRKKEAKKERGEKK